jgi:H/ACA ribonucleoprotein complex subunit 2
LAGDVSPIDVISHIPVLCEDNKLLYVYVPARESLGTASGTKRPTSVVMITLNSNSELSSTFDELSAEVKEITPSFS